MRESGSVVAEMKAAAPRFSEVGFEAAVAESLRRRDALTEQWQVWSGDQRWTPSAYLDGTEVGWFDGARRLVRQHQDQASAAADFIHRLCVWVHERRIVEERDS